MNKDLTLLQFCPHIKRRFIATLATFFHNSMAQWLVWRIQDSADQCSNDTQDSNKYNEEYTGR
jgi:hypothetical protein